MKGFDKLHVKSAVKARKQEDLSQVHLTTLEFAQPIALYHRALLPGDDFSINANYFTRMAPLARPTYGKFSFRTMSVFVPWHQVAFDADAFMSGKTAFEGITPDIRHITYLEYVNFLIDSDISTEVTSTDPYDFHYVNSSSVKKYQKFTNLGRYYFKILSSVGFSIPTNISLVTTSNWYTAFASKLLNILPLLGYLKAYNDYMSLSQRFNTSNLTSILRSIKYNIDYSSVYTASTHCITAQGLESMLSFVKVAYENDYFTSAWQQLESPIGSTDMISNFNVDPVPTVGDAISRGSGGVFALQDSSSRIYQRTLDVLQSFYNWVKRNNYAGSRDVQQVFARFGIKSEDFNANYSHLITTDKIPVQVGDVTATAEGSTVELGDYAGKGIVSGSHRCSYKSSDFGMLYIIGWFTVNPIYAYGFDREVLKSSPLEFYQPEFDGVGVDAISFGEIFTNPIAAGTDSTIDNSVYGFTERYNDYRYARDQITGEFRTWRNGSDMNVWHTGRLLNDIRGNNALVAQGSTMLQLSPINSEYNRIFSVTSGDVDHFYMVCNFDVMATRPMLSLNQVSGLGEGDLVVNRNGNEIN